MQKRIKALIRGVVQGVGFRPFVFNLAKDLGLGGVVMNTPEGVELEIEGEPDCLKEFIQRLKSDTPPLAIITDIFTSEIEVKGESEFKIQLSKEGVTSGLLISPDVAVCEDCLREMWDPEDRRYRYPFINCTNCGPRFTIIFDLPYDRPKTSMASFKMCKECEEEYHDPSNRRFHAQPNACWVCGPHIELYDSTGRRVHAEDPIRMCQEYIREGRIVAVKGLGGFHLAVDATNDMAVKRLRERKNREEKPFAIMLKNEEELKKIVFLNKEEMDLITSPERPIVLALKKKDSKVSSFVAPHINTYGVMLPYTPLHHLLLEDMPPLVMTSGNLSDEPICIDNEEARRRLHNIADFFLMHNRDILQRVDDSVLKIIRGKSRIIRRSRGYTPIPIMLPLRFKEDIMAFGAQEKNTLALLQDNRIFLSQHIGDLDHLETVAFMEEATHHLRKVLDINPTIYTCDLHPGYLSTQLAKRYAKEHGYPLFEIQHHHAHITSCLAENGAIDKPVIGVALDGLGLGTDGHLWGCEIMLVRGENFTRLVHLSYRQMPGGDLAIKEPWRMALSYLYPIYGKESIELPLYLNKVISRDKREFIVTLMEKNINTLFTSGMGRLFDAISALLGLRLEIAYSAQAAILLENIYEEGDGIYEFALDDKVKPWVIDPDPVIQKVVSDIRLGVPTEIISGKFHRGIIKSFSEILLRIREETGINSVALSGGVFQNAILLEKMEDKLETLGFMVYSHSSVPCNDGGISLGQAVIAGLKYGKYQT